MFKTVADEVITCAFEKQLEDLPFCPNVLAHLPNLRRLNITWSKAWCSHPTAMLEVENLALTKVCSLEILLPPSEQAEDDYSPPIIMHLPTLEHFRCELDINLNNIIGSQSRLVSLHLPCHMFEEVEGRINLISLTSLTLQGTEGVERVSIPVLEDLSTTRLEDVHDSISPHLTSLMVTYRRSTFDAGLLHQYTKLVTLTVTVSYSQL